MRTTINLPDTLMARVKRAAVESQTTVTAIIEDALRDALSRRRKKSAFQRAELPTYGEGGLRPGVDLDDAAALLDLMEAPGDPDRR